MKQFWLLVTVFFLVLLQGGAVALYFGMPNSCPVPGHGGPPCNMEKCRAMDKDGKKTGVNCSKFCAKSCCLCSDACPKDNNQNSPNDEEFLAYQFGD